MLLDFALRSRRETAEVALGILDLLVDALLVPPQVVDLAEGLAALIADMLLHVGMNCPLVCLS